MGSLWAEVGKEGKRRLRQQRRTDAWVRKQTGIEQRRRDCEAAGQARATKSELARQAREDGLAEVEARTTALAEELTGFADLLASVVALPARTPAWFQGRAPDVDFVPPDLKLAGRRPTWGDFAPPEPGLFGRRKYERAVQEAQAAFASAGREYDRRCAELVNAARSVHAADRARVRRQHEQLWDRLVSGIGQRDPESVAELVGAVVHSLPPLTGLLAGGRAVYQPEPREVLVEVDLPDTDVVPGERAWRYVAAHQRIDPLPRAEKDKVRIYADLISRIALAVMHASFAALDGDVIETITFNGHVRTTDTATGRPKHPCLITVTAARATFAELQLDYEKLNPAECLRFLGAELSPHPYARTHVEPFVDFDLARYRLISAPEALVDLDPRADLLQMDPFEFERLVKELFVSMGYRAWRTQDRRDDGIDAVAIREDRITPVECVIQAKRYRRLVPPHDLQALMGAMTENGTRGLVRRSTATSCRSVKISASLAVSDVVGPDGNRHVVRRIGGGPPHAIMS